MDFGRLVTAMVTPFDAELNVNREQVGALIDYLIGEQASDSLVISGTTGESPTLSDEEKMQLFADAVEHSAGRCKIIAGTGSYDTAHSIRLTQMAEQAGVDGILLVAPYYNRPSQEGLYRHFKAIAESTTLPVMLYNVPKRTGITIEPETIFRLAELPNVVASKEAVSDLDHVTTIIKHAPAHFKVYCGDDSLTLPFLAIGAHGIVSVASHVVGKEMKTMIDAFLAGRVADAAAKHAELHPVFTGLFEAPSPAPVKYALKIKGIDPGGVRLPLVDVPEDVANRLRALLA